VNALRKLYVFFAVKKMSQVNHKEYSKFSQWIRKEFPVTMYLKMKNAINVIKSLKVLIDEKV